MSGPGSKTLILNPGSSSLKFRVYNRGEIEADGIVDGIGEQSNVVIDYFLENDIIEKFNARVMNHEEAGKIIIKRVNEFCPGIDRVVYRVVHGGEFARPEIINEDLMKKLKELIPLAPLHMPNTIRLIELFRREFKGKHIACFDSSFHHEMPEVARNYALPLRIMQKYPIRRFGFHGISHKANVKEAIRLSEKHPRKIISCQLGNGASVCAIKDGKSIDTSMGFTPLEGIMMGTRSGSIDPAIIEYLCKAEKKSIGEIVRMLQKESGLKGLTGEWDVRKILEKEKKGDRRARFALDLFGYHVKRQIGAYFAALNGVDMIVLGGGIPRAPLMRKRICEGLEELGIIIDSSKINKEAPVCITKGKTEVWVVETDEQKEMFETTRSM